MRVLWGSNTGIQGKSYNQRPKSMRKDNNTALPHFKTIGIVGHPRHPEALATHELIYHWLISKIIMPLSINKLLKI